MSKFVVGFVLAIVAAAGFYILPWKIGDWGTMVTRPVSTITVTGEAKSSMKNQIASFNVGINLLGDDKQKAVDEVNRKISEVITTVRSFGIKEEDIKTQSLSINQNEDNNRWRVGNTVEVVLRDVERASALADVLAKTGANSVYGPNFTVEDSQSVGNKLLGEAVDDAWKKAEIIAKAANKKIIKIISVTEGVTVTPGPYYYGAGGGGGDKLEAGSQLVNKNVTVVFEIL